MKKAVILQVRIRYTADLEPDEDIVFFAAEEIRKRLHMDSAKSQHGESVRVLGIVTIEDADKEGGDTPMDTDKTPAPQPQPVPEPEPEPTGADEAEPA